MTHNHRCTPVTCNIVMKVSQFTKVRDTENQGISKEKSQQYFRRHMQYSDLGDTAPYHMQQSDHGDTAPHHMQYSDNGETELNHMQHSDHEDTTGSQGI